jgi:peptidoglycan/LPS O-acetylase OafA/YrhL
MGVKIRILLKKRWINMDRKTSVYLDLLRVIATLSVFIGHFSYEQFSGGFFSKIGGFRNDAVMIFFVLSGYLIAYVVNQKDKNLSGYFISRFSRLYSVLLPAMILTITLDFIGRYSNPELYQDYYVGNSLIKTLANLFYLQEVWNGSIRFFSNGPLWSLGYEFWFYAIFGLLFYMRKKTWATILSIALLILFYKVTLLFPVWLLGVLAFHLKEKVNLSKKVSYIVFLATPIFYLAFYKVGILNHFTFESLGFSKNFIGNYITGVLVFFNLISFNQLNFSFITKFAKPIKFLADFSFSVYLYHFVLIVFIASIFKYDTNNVFVVSIVALSILVICYLLSLFTEKKKHLYKLLFTKLFNLFGKNKQLVHKQSGRKVS